MTKSPKPKKTGFLCLNCNCLLYKATSGLDTELICPRCRRINYPARDKNDVTGLRGVDFQNKAIDHNCPRCHRLLLRSIGQGVLEVTCRHCSKELDNLYLVEYDTMEMAKGNHPVDKSAKSMKIRESIAK